VVVASILRGVVDRGVTVALRGGELSIQWDGDGASVFMTGPAASVFTGRIEIERS
jgi:diaminopimelate epimerase